MTESQNGSYDFCDLIHDGEICLAPRNSSISIGSKYLQERENLTQYCGIDADLDADFGIGKPLA